MGTETPEAGIKGDEPCDILRLLLESFDVII